MLLLAWYWLEVWLSRIVMFCNVVMRDSNVRRLARHWEDEGDERGQFVGSENMWGPWWPDHHRSHPLPAPPVWRSYIQTLKSSQVVTGDTFITAAGGFTRYENNQEHPSSISHHSSRRYIKEREKQISLHFLVASSSSCLDEDSCNGIR